MEQTQLLLNPEAQSYRDYGPAQAAVLNAPAFAMARAEICSWPGYAPTPLIALPALAAERGVTALTCKHEGARFGIGSFKPTGPTYAMLAVLKGEVRRATGVAQVSTEDLVTRRYAEIIRDIVVAAPTSGNHGRALAWGARTFGCRAVLYMNDSVSAGREAAIRGYGGEVVRVPGAYAQAVQQMLEDDAVHGYFIVADQGTPAYPQVQQDIMQGYALVADELVDQSAPALPTHLFVPGGGGILAAACCAHLWERLGRDRPRVIVVEPTASCCLYASARAGRAVQVAAATSVMDGLVVERPAAEAWPLLSAGAFAFLTVPDQAAVEAMCLAADPHGDDPALVIGDTGSAGWAGFLAVSSDPALRRSLGLSAASRVAVVVTEEATDAAVYQRIVGRAP